FRSAGGPLTWPWNTASRKYVAMTDMANTTTQDSAPVRIASAHDADADIDLDLLESTLDYIRPAIQMDGGDIVLQNVDEGVVTLQMVGACGGCPLSMMTLKAGIERILKDRVPGVVSVEATACPRGCALRSRRGWDRDVEPRPRRRPAGVGPVAPHRGGR